MEVNLEDFIAVKGIKAIGNQLTSEKIRQVNRLEPLPYTPPVIEDVEVNDEEILDNESTEKHANTEMSKTSDSSNEDKNNGTSNNSEDSSNEENNGQITLF